MMDSYWVIPDDSSDICHYGVKGMKWGVRKSEYRSMSRSDRKAQRAKYKTEFVDKQNSSYTKRQRELDRKRYGRRAVKRMNEGMNQGYTHKQVVAKEKVHATRRGALIGAAVGAGEMAIMPGCSAVSPPMRAQPDCTQPSATPETRVATFSGSFLPMAI